MGTPLFHHLLQQGGMEMRHNTTPCPPGKGPCEHPRSGVRIGDWPSSFMALLPKAMDLRQYKRLTPAGTGAAGLALLFPSVFLKMPL